MLSSARADAERLGSEAVAEQQRLTAAAAQRIAEADQKLAQARVQAGSELDRARAEIIRLDRGAAAPSAIVPMPRRLPGGMRPSRQARPRSGRPRRTSRSPCGAAGPRPSSRQPPTGRPRRPRPSGSSATRTSGPLRWQPSSSARCRHCGICTPRWARSSARLPRRERARQSCRRAFTVPESAGLPVPRRTFATYSPFRLGLTAAIGFGLAYLLFRACDPRSGHVAVAAARAVPGGRAGSGGAPGASPRPAAGPGRRGGVRRCAAVADRARLRGGTAAGRADRDLRAQPAGLRRRTAAQPPGRRAGSAVRRAQLGPVLPQGLLADQAAGR